MADCEQCAALQRQNDLLANDRDGYVQVLTDENNKLRAEVERLNKSRNKWGQKYNKLLEKHKVTVSQLKAAVWSDSEECKLLTAENEKLRAYALKAFTVVEFCSGEGLLLPHPTYDCDDLLMEGVELLKVETSEEARAALEEK